MKLVIAAIPIEAQPFIKHFNLKKDLRSQKIPFYFSEKICLAISGVGKIKAAIATTFALTKIEIKEELLIFNFGICGTPDSRLNKGTLCWVNRITDASTGRNYLPEALLKHALPEHSLVSYDKPIRKNTGVSVDIEKNQRFSLVDMEASGFFAAAQVFLPPERIICIKLVSDHLEDQLLEKTLVTQWIEKTLNPITKLFEQSNALILPNKKLSAKNEKRLQSLEEKLRLTSTQSHQLKKAAMAYLKRSNSQETSLDFLFADLASPRNKSERNIRFKIIQETLYSDHR